MKDFMTLFAPLLLGFGAYWCCGHSIAVALNGGPCGDRAEPYQRAGHPVRFWCYVVACGIAGVLLAAVTVLGFVRIWKALVIS